MNKAWFRDLQVELICGAQYFVVVLWCNCGIAGKASAYLLPSLTQQQ
jgi:hypothetical protein